MSRTSPFLPRRRLRHFVPLLLGLAMAGAWAQPVPLPAESLPPAVAAALAQSRVPAQALSAWVADVQPSSTVFLQHRAREPVNPASVMKLVSTYAALDLLGPAYTWNTSVHLDGPVVDGVLQGNLYIRGSGDPKLVTERAWLLMRRVQGLGIQRITGDMVLDRSAFSVPPTDPAAFDGEPLRPYNAGPDALLVNFKSVVMTFSPDVPAGVARVAVEPPLAGVAIPATVPLQAGGACNDWRGQLRGDFRDPARPQFLGSYPLACGERAWPLAYPEPERFAERALLGLWQAVGGRLDGRVREGTVPPQLPARLTMPSPPLSEVVRDVNKFSNNVMAQQLFLTLGLGARGEPATFDAARARTAQWWRDRMGPDVPVPDVDNGAGLSRSARSTAQALGRLLQVAWASGQMPELMASLPIVGQDGTMRRSRAVSGIAHLKTGSLADVVALAGYVHGPGGRRVVLVAIINHPAVSTDQVRPVMDALVNWSAGL